MIAPDPLEGLLCNELEASGDLTDRESGAVSVKALKSLSGRLQ